MKTLRIFWQNFSLEESNESTAYMDINCTSWEVAGSLLVIYQKGGCRFVPLVTVRTFQELSNG